MKKPGLQGHKYLLLMVDTFTGWVEAFPTRSESALTGVKNLLYEIIPRFSLPLSMGSDNGPAFIAQITEKLTQAYRLIGNFIACTGLKLRASREDKSDI